LNVLSIINEPTAAAISYGMEKTGDQVVLVYDLGGGTFDITMIEIKGGGITVICTGGDHNLGGKDWDAIVVSYLADQFRQQTGSSEDILENRETLQDLNNRAEAAKKTLSKRETAPIRVSHGETAKVELARQKFDELTADKLERTITLTHEVLAEARKKDYNGFDRILLVGGSTRMPQVQARVQKEFAVPCEIYDPDESVAKGAAIYGWKLALDEAIKIQVSEVTGQNAEQVDVSKTDAKVIEQAKQEVARQYGLSAATVKRAAETKIADVTSKTFGIVVTINQQGEKVNNLIRKNDPVPADVCRTFGTREANQEFAQVRLMETQGTDELSELSMCTELGTAELPLPPNLPAGAPIHVKFVLNRQGRLEVYATEPVTQKTVQIQVDTASIMSAQEVENACARGLAIEVS